MRYVAAYLLAVLGGKTSPEVGDIEKILHSVGIDADSEKLKKVIGELDGKNIDEVIAQGKEKLGSLPVGGKVAAPVPVEAAPAVAEVKKEEKKPEKKDESDSDDDDMGFGLFD